MDVSTRRLIVQRAAPYFDTGVVPQSWESLPLDTKVAIKGNDPELAAVWSGKIPADLELKLLNGEWSGEPIEPKTEQQLKEEKEAAIQAVFAGMAPAKTPEELEAAMKSRLAEQQQAARNSFVQAHGRWQ